MASGEISASALRRGIRQVMEQRASVVRTTEGLLRGLAQIREMQRFSVFMDSRGASFLLETRGMLLVAEMVLAAAALRHESRGPHLLFSDYSDTVPIARDDTRWSKYIVIGRDAAGMRLEIRDPLATGE